MASPVADSYSGPSGGVIAGGRFVAPAWRRSMQKNAWGEIPSTLLSSIDPNNDPLINPNYPSQGPWNRKLSGYVNYTTLDGIIIPWCGGAWDEDKKTLWLPLGGGHGDSANNAAYKICLGDDSPVWSSPRPPSGALPLISGGIPAGATAQGNSFLLDDGLETTGVYADGRPRSTHSYRKHVYVPGIGPVMGMHGGMFISTATSSKQCWRMDEASGEWEWKSSAHIVAAEGGIANGCCYDSTRGVLLWLGAGFQKMHRLDFDTWTYQPLGTGTAGFSGDVAIEHIKEYDVVFHVSASFDSKFVLHDAATGAIFNPGATTDPPITIAANIGFAWVPALQSVVFLAAGGAIHTLSPTGNPKTEAWEWGQLATTGTPPALTSQGIYSRFGYSKKLGGCYLVTASTVKPWFLALN